MSRLERRAPGESRFASYEEVDTALDQWLSERPGSRNHKCVRVGSDYVATLTGSGEETSVGRSKFSSNDATGKALDFVLDAELVDLAADIEQVNAALAHEASAA